METKKTEESLEQKVETSQPAKKENKEKTPQKPKKTEAKALGNSYPLSRKHSLYVCYFIKNKSIDKAIEDLNQVLKFKRAVPFKGEIPHRKNLSGSGRYPITACKHFINLLKSLKGNCLSNGMDIDNTKIYEASATWASRPRRSGGKSAKRTNIILKAKEFPTGGKN